MHLASDISVEEGLSLESVMKWKTKKKKECRKGAFDTKQLECGWKAVDFDDLIFLIFL